MELSFGSQTQSRQTAQTEYSALQKSTLDDKCDNDKPQCDKHVTPKVSN